MAELFSWLKKVEGLVHVFWELYFFLLEKEALEIDSEVAEAFKKYIRTNGIGKNQPLSMSQCSCSECSS